MLSNAILVAIILMVVYVGYTKTVEGWRPRKSFYDSGLPCGEFCAKIKKEDMCMNFNYKENTKCYNGKGTPVMAHCYYKGENCMSLV